MARRSFTTVGGSGYPRASFWKQALGVDYYANGQGGEPVYSEDAQAVLDLLTGLTTDEKTAIAAFIDSQVLSGNWAKLDTFQPYWMGAMNGMIDWKGNCEPSNPSGYSFVTGGVDIPGSGAGIVTDYNPTTGTNWEARNAVEGAYVFRNDSSTNGKILIGGSAPLWSQSTTASRLDFNVNGIIRQITSYPTGWEVGLWSAKLEESGANEVARVYKNGTDLGIGNNLGATERNEVVRVGGRSNGASPFDGVVGLYYAGGGDGFDVTNFSDNLEILLDFFFSVETAMQLGDMETLYAGETYEQITARRQKNWDLLRWSADTGKLTETSIALSGHVEFYRPLNQSINILSGETLTINGGGKDSTELVFYPFTMRQEAGNYVFNVEYGGSISLNDVTCKMPVQQSKLETYDCIIKKGGNATLIEITSDVRPDFWDELEVGDKVYHSYTNSVLAERTTIVGWDVDAKTITVADDIVAASDTVGIIGRHFREDIPADDYDTYGAFWRWNQFGGFQWAALVRSLPSADSGADSTFDFDNVLIENFGYAVNVSSGNFHITYSDLEINNALVAFSVFARSQMNGQSITGTNLTLRRNGVFFNGAVDSLDAAASIYGAGGYVHPTVIFTENGTLTLIDNAASGFRQYSASVEEAMDGVESYVNRIIANGTSQYDFYSSNCMPVVIDYIECDDLRIGGSVTINGGIIRRDASGSVALEPPDGTPCVWEFNDMDWYGYVRSEFNVLTEAVHDITFNRCRFFADTTTNLLVFIIGQKEINSLTLNDCEPLKNPSVMTIPAYVGGEAVPSGDSCSFLFAAAASKLITVNRLTTDAMKGKLIYRSPNIFNIPPYNTAKIILNDCDIQLSSLTDLSFGSNQFYNSNQIEGHGTNMLAFNFAGVGYNMPFAFESAEASKSGVNILSTSQTYKNSAGALAPFNSFSVDGVLEIDFLHNEYFVNAGTINRIVLRTWAGVDKIASETCFNGEIIIHAVGGDVVLNGWDASTNEYGNIEEDITISSGTSKTLICNNKGVFAKSSNTTVEDVLGTGDGDKTVFTGNLDDFLIAPKNFTITAGAVTGTADADGNIVGAGIDASSFIDYGTGTYYVLFDAAVAEGTDVEVSYEKYADWRVTGIWSEVE